MFRHLLVGVLALAAAAPTSAHGPDHTMSGGKPEAFVWTFVRTPNLEFACDIPGHYEDGMHGTISFDR
jgi:uncharacterized cupredoxin-like copper-binding protein